MSNGRSKPNEIAALRARLTEVETARDAALSERDYLEARLDETGRQLARVQARLVEVDAERFRAEALLVVRDARIARLEADVRVPSEPDAERTIAITRGER